MNLRYDKPDIVIYKKGDICTYGDFSFCMKTKEFMTYDEIRRNFSEIKEDYSELYPLSRTQEILVAPIFRQL